MGAEPSRAERAGIQARCEPPSSEPVAAVASRARALALSLSLSPVFPDLLSMDRSHVRFLLSAKDSSWYLCSHVRGKCRSRGPDRRKNGAPESPIGARSKIQKFPNGNGGFVLQHCRWRRSAYLPVALLHDPSYNASSHIHVPSPLASTVYAVYFRSVSLSLSLTRDLRFNNIMLNPKTECPRRAIRRLERR